MTCDLLAVQFRDWTVCRGISHAPWDLLLFSPVFTLVYFFNEVLCVCVFTYIVYISLFVCVCIYTYTHPHIHSIYNPIIDI